jgi:hypothetical protein
MWLKIKRFLQQPIPGTPTRQEIGTFIQFLTRRIWFFFQWSMKLILVALLVWMVGGNMLANHLQKRLDADVAEFIARFPDSEPNDSALRLMIHMAQLGMGHGFPPATSGLPSVFDDYYQYMESDSVFRRNTANELVFQKGDYFSDYLNELKVIDQPTLPLMPEEVSSYLDQNSETIAAIIQHLTSQEIPQWGSDANAFLSGPEMSLPSHLNIVYLVRVILLKSIQDFMSQDFKTVETDLNAAWNLHESLKYSHTLIGQLVGLILGQDILPVLQYIQPLSGDWQDKMVGREYFRPLIVAIRIDFLGMYSFLRRGQKEIGGVMLGHRDLYGLNSLRFRILQPYYRFMSINLFALHEELIEKMQDRAQSPCAFRDQLAVKVPWWNIIAAVSLPSFFNQPDRVTEFMLRLEMTQKLLQAKEKARETGNWPEQLADLESNVCPGERWLYEGNGDTLSLRFSQTPNWLQDRIENGDAQPLEYRSTLSRIKPDAVDPEVNIGGEVVP